MVSSDGDQGAPATRSTRQLEPAAAASPFRTPLPKTTREFGTYSRLINSWHPFTNESYHLRSRHLALPVTEERVDGIDRSFNRSRLELRARPISAQFVRGALKHRETADDDPPWQL
jgi:hypothetical protein